MRAKDEEPDNLLDIPEVISSNEDDELAPKKRKKNSMAKKKGKNEGARAHQDERHLVKRLTGKLVAGSGRCRSGGKNKNGRRSGV